MEIVKLLEYLQEILQTSTKFPMGKVLVNKKEALEITEEIINMLPEEFKKAQWLLQEKDRILGDALTQAEDIKIQNIKRIQNEVENHDFVIDAKNRAEEIIAVAQSEAKAIRLSARDYADDLLVELNNEIITKKETMMDSIKDEMEKFLVNVNNAINSNDEELRENIKELRNMKISE